MGKTPITIFSGYLGSGKTTIIIKSLKAYSGTKRFAMIKNEYGDASVDGSLAQLNNLAVTELVNGCLCCVLVGSLNDAVNELIEKQHPERILIEASGDALPFPIILELKKNDNVYIDGVISVVDCVNFERVKDTSMVAREQAKYTDLIIFNKAELVDADTLYRVKEEIFGINPDTVKIDTTGGVVDPAVLFGIDHIDSFDQEEMLHHHHEMETFTYTSSSLMQREKVNDVLLACSPNSFFRIKGICHCDDHVYWLVNSVFGRMTWEKLNAGEGDTRIIFIGKDINRFKPMLTEYLDKTSQ